MKNDPYLTKIVRPNKYLSDFKEMPFYLKIIFLLWLFGICDYVVNIVFNKPLLVEYFNTGFPKNMPLLWNLFWLLYSISYVAVYFKRSFSLLKKYLYLNIFVFVFNTLNGVFRIINTPEYRFFNILAQLLVICIFFFTTKYLFGQKKYFNRD